MAASFRVSPTAVAAQGIPATALGGEAKYAKAISLIGLGMPAFPCCIDETRRPGMQARRSVASLAALSAVCFGRRGDARATSAELVHNGRPQGETDAFGRRPLSHASRPFTGQIVIVRLGSASQFAAPFGYDRYLRIPAEDRSRRDWCIPLPTRADSSFGLGAPDPTPHAHADRRSQQK
jgi:hypothetical protein